MDLPDYLTRDLDGFIRLTGHRIGLHDIVLLYEEGYSPEMLLGQFPTLSLALIHKVLAFYLDNQNEVGRYASGQIEATERQRTNPPPGPQLQDLRDRMRRARAS